MWTVHPVLWGWTKVANGLKNLLREFFFYLKSNSFIFLAEIPSNNSKSWGFAFINIGFFPAKKIFEFMKLGSVLGELMSRVTGIDKPLPSGFVAFFLTPIPPLSSPAPSYPLVTVKGIFLGSLLPQALA